MPDAAPQHTASKEPFLEMDTDKSHGSLSSIILVILIVFIVLITGFFVFYKYSLSSKAKDKEATLNGLIEEINSSGSQQTREQAVSIDAALNILRTETKTKYSFKTFIDSFVGKMTNDTRLVNMSIDSQGVLAIDGLTSSYRSVADLALALEKTGKLTDVKIGSLSKNGDGAESVTFSISATLSDWNTNNLLNATTSTGEESSAEAVPGVSL